MFNIYSLLDTIRPKPGMYLGEPALSSLYHLLSGYKIALVMHDIAYEHVGIWSLPTRELPDFHAFVARKFEGALYAEGYLRIILRQANGDEREALELFWVLLDEYRAQEEALGRQVLPPRG